ncbi:MAG: hypothetical protein BroJett026_11560 [Betaproteobacteria bacterium]|nr:MAG: hypothetical protein BroJett026_11560 [Betaproteobacteria bacterium]
MLGCEDRAGASGASACPMKIVVVAGLLAIVTALFAALVFLYRDRGHGTRMVKALAIRVGLSVSLVVFLLVSYWLGWIGPQGLR